MNRSAEDTPEYHERDLATRQASSIAKAARRSSPNSTRAAQAGIRRPQVLKGYLRPFFSIELLQASALHSIFQDLYFQF